MFKDSGQYGFTPAWGGGGSSFGSVRERRWGAAEDFPPPSLEVELLNSLVGLRRFSSSTPAFTGSDQRTVMGYASGAVKGDEMVLLTVEASEPRFWGARRVSQGVWSRYFSDGTPIPDADMLGIVIEVGASQRLNITKTRDLTDNAVWVRTNATAARTATGLDGVANMATTLTASSASATIYQTPTLSSASRWFYVWIRRRTGTGAVRIKLAGTTVDITALINTSRFTPVAVGPVTAANPAVGFEIDSSGDEIDVDYAQLTDTGQTNGPVLPYIEGSTGSAGDQIASGYAWGGTEALGTLYAEGSSFIHSMGSGPTLVSAFAGPNDTASIGGCNLSGITASVFNGGPPQAIVTAASVMAARAARKSAMCWTTNYCKAFAGGVAGAADTSVTPGSSSTTILVGRLSTAGPPAGCAIVRKVRCWTQCLTDAQLIALTT